ncbi:DUF805 domain-containing protein [Acidaminococcus timonensis]|uniref:DUF805 domain-containing protein n=1 Tax=Acidaminococcus timonensis TaxID=1871002 RepID=UPI0026F294ED|nr:DUF805 domain-containing protein [Acidaminococcus timonensis]
MKTCPKCHKIYEDSQNFCSIDGTKLVLTPVSQALRSNGQQPEEQPQPEAAQPESAADAQQTEPVQDPQPQPDMQQEDAQQQTEQQNQQSQQTSWQQQNWQYQQQQNQYQYRPTNDPSFSARFQANIPDANTWKPMYFSFDGRLSRGDYVCRWLLLLGCAVVVSLICGIISILAPIGALAFIALCVAQISISVRRLHDRGHSGLWLFVCVIPAANLIMFLYLLFAAGQPGVNEYGAAE